MEHINHQRLDKMIKGKEAAAVINVLSKDDFTKEHIPGSENIPLKTENFETKVEQRLGSKEKPVIVYCASATCPASQSAAKKLEAAGFTHVYEFDGGMDEWKKTGHPIEPRKTKAESQINLGATEKEERH